jgi:VWFA-related protein
MDQVEVALKQLYVTVTKSGEPVRGLSKSHFTLYDNQVRQELVTFGTGDVPLTAVLLLDASESMKGRYLQATIEGSRAFLSRLNDLDRAMVMLFSDRTLAATPFSQSEVASVLGQLEGKNLVGGTALNDHVYASLRVLDRAQGRRVVILLSDGADVLSCLRMQDVLWKVRRSDAVIYWIRLLKEDRSSFSSAWRGFEANRQEQELLEQAVAESGGRIEVISDLEEIPGAFDAIMTELREQYALGYYPSGQLADGSWQPIKVKIDHPGARARYRAGYVPY